MREHGCGSGQPQMSGSQARLRILADDLTGAADTAASLARGPAGVDLFLTVDAAPGQNGAAAFDLNSRAMTEQEALRTVLAAAAAISCPAAAGGLRFYKKIDSALRGHVAAETKALLDALPALRAALVAPAFPAMGRTVVGGYAFEGARRLGKTGQSLSEQFSRVAARRDEVIVLRLETVRSDAQALQGTIEAGLRQGGRFLIADAESEADLQAAARACSDVGQALLWVGSAGLARVMAGRAPARHALRAPTLVVAGSHARATLSQLDVLRSDPGISFVAVELSRIASRLPEQQAAALGEHARSELESGRDVVLCADGNSSPVADDNPVLSLNLGRLAAHAIRAANAVVLTGGDTARSVLTAIGVRQLTVYGEASVGLPLCKVQGMGTQICLKSGGFGSPGLLLDLLREARRREVLSTATVADQERK